MFRQKAWCPSTSWGPTDSVRANCMAVCFRCCVFAVMFVSRVQHSTSQRDIVHETGLDTTRRCHWLSFDSDRQLHNSVSSYRV